MRKLKNILVTGGCGFIGSNFINFLFGESPFAERYCENNFFDGRIINVDKLTYAANPENLSKIQKKYGGTRYFFEKADICDKASIFSIFQKYQIDTVVHFAAESHVDRSISSPEIFIKTNVLGTQILLEAAKNFWKSDEKNPEINDFLFHYISTDEVYGSLDFSSLPFTEKSNYNPSSPYSASKASGEHLCFAYNKTYGLPVTVSSCSNNYGPFQNPEKFIPLMLKNIKSGAELPVYGSGNNVRDWIYVDDHCNAVFQILKNGKTGQKYNIGGECELSNNDLLEKLIEIYCNFNAEKESQIKKRIRHVTDRPGHDLRYAINCERIKSELNWTQKVSLTEGLKKLTEN